LILGLLWVSDGDQTLRLPARMPRFYFDISDDGRAERDHEGLEFDSLDKAREQAIKTLGEIARDELPDGNGREFKITIRDQHGKSLILASRTLRVERLD